MDINKAIDHTALKAETTELMIKKLCEEAIEYSFKAVCVNPTQLELCRELLKNTDIGIATVVGFPLGANTTSTKVFETKDAIEKGATEIDMVANIGSIKDGNWEKVEFDIAKVVEAAHPKALVKVIIETSLLDDNEKIKVCEAAKRAKADFVKTSTGFSSGGATAHDVILMKETVGPNIEVKASGGIKDYKTAKLMLDSGATRIGASSGIAIVKGTVSDTDY